MRDRIETVDNSKVPGVESVRLKLKSGWSAVVAFSDSIGRMLDVADWKACLSNPESLMADPGKSLKTDRSTSVMLKAIQLGEHKKTVVIKHHKKAPGLKGMFRSLQSSRAIRNFRTAAKLCGADLPTARPLAAIDRKIGPATIESIYITEYVENSSDLYHFLKNHSDTRTVLDLKLKKQLGNQIFRIFAGLDMLGLWHQDAKAGNFLVHKDSLGEHSVVLVDMDGIKPCPLSDRKRRFTSLAKLASTLVWSSQLTTGDYLRIFSDYARITDLEMKKQRPVFKSIERQAHAIRLLTMARTAIKDASRPDRKT